MTIVLHLVSMNIKDNPSYYYEMKSTCLLSILLFLSACSSNERNLPQSMEIIPIEYENATEDAASFLEKIEIVPLETNDSSVISYHAKAIYDKEMDMYAFYFRNQVVYTFSGNGTYISNSKKMKGKGPREYYMAMDIQFNPYLNGIDLLSPYGTVYTYSPTFELIAKRNYQQEFPVNKFMPLDSVNYLFTYPNMWTDQEVSFENIETHQKTNTAFQGTIGNNNMSKSCFYKRGTAFDFVPFGLNYYLYQIDKQKKELLPVAYLDFGSAEVKSKNLPGISTGQRTKDDAKQRAISKGLQERYQYLFNSTEIIPEIKLFNEDYVYVFMVKTTMPGRTFLYNRKTKKGFLLKDGVPFDMFFCFDIVDNILLSLCSPREISHFIDRRFMSEEEIHKMEQLKEEDNPVIIKYHLKRQ